MWTGVKKIFGAIDETVITDEYKDILDEFEKGRNLFVTGKAGTGKSRLVEYLRKQTKKNIVVLAPTGIAAINVKGQTIHSFFKLPPRMLTPETVAKIKPDKMLFKKLDAIVIDEASMVRADVIDAIDTLLRKHGPDRMEAFGGIQVVMVGDMFQLPPVVRYEEMEAFRSLYPTSYFFGSGVYSKGRFLKKSLTRVFRQTDEEFIDILNRLRMSNVMPTHLETLNGQVNKDCDKSKSVLLAATNKIVNEINMMNLEKLTGVHKKYMASLEGDFASDERAMPVEPELTLKKNARVMILKNGLSYVNGSMGIVSKLGDGFVLVILDETGEEVEIGQEEWENVKYKLNPVTEKVEELKTGTMKQLPLRLCWAVTIHKSQGMSFDRVHIDLTASPFAHGQTYVALSRCRSLEGLTLSRPLTTRDVIIDPEIVRFENGD